MLTYFVVQSFRLTPKGAITPGEAVEVQDVEHALRLAQKLAASSAGVVAFSRTGDPSTGEFEDAVVLYANGAVPLLEPELCVLKRGGLFRAESGNSSKKLRGLNRLLQAWNACELFRNHLRVVTGQEDKRYVPRFQSEGQFEAGSAAEVHIQQCTVRSLFFQECTGVLGGANGTGDARPGILEDLLCIVGQVKIILDDQHCTAGEKFDDHGLFPLALRRSAGTSVCRTLSLGLSGRAMRQ